MGRAHEGGTHLAHPRTRNRPNYSKNVFPARARPSPFIETVD